MIQIPNRRATQTIYSYGLSDADAKVGKTKNFLAGAQKIGGSPRQTKPCARGKTIYNQIYKLLYIHITNYTCIYIIYINHMSHITVFIRLYHDLFLYIIYVARYITAFTMCLFFFVFFCNIHSVLGIFCNNSQGKLTVCVKVHFAQYMYVCDVHWDLFRPS